MASKFNVGSLAFLDLLTCGLGGVLLLFFIVVAVRETDSIENMNSSAALEQEDRVVLIQLSVASKQSLFAQESRKFYWEKDGLEIDQPKNVEISDGESFLVVYANGKLPGGTCLMITGLNTRNHIQGMIFDRFGSRNLKITDLSKPVCLYKFGSRSSNKKK